MEKYSNVSRTVFTVCSCEVTKCFDKEVIIFRGVGHLGSTEVFNLPTSEINCEKLFIMPLPLRIDRDSLSILDCSGNVYDTLKIRNEEVK